MRNKKHLSGAVIEQYINWEMTTVERERFRQHLKGCQRCTKAYRRALVLESLLEGYLEHVETKCPTSEVLLGFVSGELDRKKRFKVETHVKSCALCPIKIERMEELISKPIRQGDLLFSMAENPTLIEKECRRFVRSAIPHEAKWLDLILESLMSVVRKVGKGGIGGWSSFEDPRLATSVGFLGTDSVHLVSPGAILAIWMVFKEIKRKRRLTKEIISRIVDKVATKMRLSEHIRDEIRSNFLEIFKG